MHKAHERQNRRTGSEGSKFAVRLVTVMMPAEAATRHQPSTKVLRKCPNTLRIKRDGRGVRRRSPAILAHKAEHAVDLETGALLAVTLQAAKFHDFVRVPAGLGIEQCPLVKFKALPFPATFNRYINGEQSEPAISGSTSARKPINSTALT